MKKVLIFGATGNTGAYLVDYCLDHLDHDEYEIVAIGRRKTDYFTRRGISYHSVDITHFDDFEQLPNEGIHSVIHMAAILPSSMEGYRPEDYIRCNVMGTFNILEYCRRVAVDRIVYTQTIRDIGQHIGKGYPLRHDMPRHFSFTGDHAVYVITKNAAVDLIEHYYQQYGIKRFILRLPTIYAYTPNEYFYVDGIKRPKAYRLMIRQATKGEPIEMWGDPSKAHDIVYVKDLCQMISKTIVVDRSSGFYNVGTGSPVSLRDQIEGIIQVFSPKENPSVIIPCPEKPNARSYTMDISNAIEELGYMPQYDYLNYLRDFKLEMEMNRYKDLRI